MSVIWPHMNQFIEKKVRGMGYVSSQLQAQSIVHIVEMVEKEFRKLNPEITVKRQEWNNERQMPVMESKEK